MASKSLNIARYEKVFATLIKYGFEDILSHPPLNKIFPQKNSLVPSRGGIKVSQYTRFERIRLVCEELGTTYIKFAQIASNRPDLLPEDLISELEKLQDNVPTVPFESIKEVLKNSLSRPIEELVEYLDPNPLASASMAQVHRARLIGGKEVVLKVQRPGIADIIKADIGILKNIVSIIEAYFPDYKNYQPRELVKMFERSINEELNFRMEAKNLKHFQNNFKSNDLVYVPALYEEICTDKVLCMEYIDGYKITDLASITEIGITGEWLALKGIGLYYEQIFDHSFFHADPHPGNILVLRNGKIAFIDFGMMGTVIEKDKMTFASILLAMYEGDVKDLKKAILVFAPNLSEDLKRDLEYDLIYFIRNYTDVAIENLDGNEIMKGLNSMFYDYKLRIPSNLLLLLKALIIIEGVGLKLDPNYDIIKNIGPYVKKLFLTRFDPSKIQKDILKGSADMTDFLSNLPEDLKIIVNKIKNGKIHIEFEHKGLEPLYKTSQTIVNRLSFSLIIVAIIIASALLFKIDFPYKLFHIPIVSIVGLVIALFLSFRLFYSIRKHGNF